MAFVVVLILLFLYARHWCIIVFCTGGTLNMFVVSINQGQMPVIPRPGIIMDYRHKFVDSNTKLFYLCDWIDVSYHNTILISIMSVGDVFIYSAGFISLAHMIFLK